MAPASASPARTRRGEILMIVGAIVLFVGPMLTFANVDVTGAGAGFEAQFDSITGAQSGYELEEGSTYVLFGLVTLAMAIALWFASTSGARKVLAGIGLLSSLVALGAGFIDFSGVSDVGGASQGLLEATAGAGVWVVILGALIATVGSVLAFSSAGPAPALAGPGPTETPPAP